MNSPSVKISVYINEGDEWKHRPLHMALLRMLHEEGIAGGTVLHAVAGFTGHGQVESSSLVDAGGRLPLVIEFIDSAEAVERVMPKLTTMAAHRLIVRQNVEIVNDGAPAP
jgi:PII-like signaling protein